MRIQIAWYGFVMNLDITLQSFFAETRKRKISTAESLHFFAVFLSPPGDMKNRALIGASPGTAHYPPTIRISTECYE